MSRARQLLKAAAAGKAVGKVLYGAGKAAKSVVVGAGEFGAGIAEGMNVAPEVGKAVGMTAAVGAGAAGAGKAKRKTDEWRYRNGLY
jgi:hypothetical protein